jgi:hypothetical protein
VPNAPPRGPVCVFARRLTEVAVLALVFAICTTVPGSVLAQTFICHAEPDSVDAVLAAGGQAPYPGGAFIPAQRVSVHLLRDDTGTAGFSTEDADSLLARMVAEFDEVGIQLLEVARHEVHDSAILADPIDAAAALFASSGDSSSINIFLGSPAGTIEGTVSGIPGRSLVLTGSAVGTSALSHFMGHCLGLYETDETAFGVESPDGSNSATAGDLVTDTPPASSSVNILEGAQVAMWEEFTPEQGARMRTAIALVELLSESEYSSGVRYINTTALTNLNYDGVPSNATAADFSGDGRLDLVVTADHSLFESASLDEATGVPWFHDRTVQMVSGSAIRLAVASSGGVIAADYDNDGDLDLYFPRTTGHILLRNESGNTFSDMTGLLDNTLYDRPSMNGAWGDYDGDGFVDLVSVVPPATEEEDGSSALVLYHNNGGTSFSVNTTKGITGPHTRLQSVLWGDLNFDQRLDLVAVQTGPHLPYYPDQPPQPEGTSSRYWVQQSDGSFALQGIDGDNHYLQYRSCQGVLMDVEPDGDLDLVYTSVHGTGHFTNGWAPGENVLRADLSYGHAIAFQIECSPHGGCDEGVYRNLIDIDVCDFNLDGKPDFVAPDPDTYAYPCLAIHEIPPARYTSTIKEDHDWYGVDRVSGGVVVADFDENGSQDIYMARAVGTNDYFFRPVKSEFGDFGNWVGIKLRSYDPGCNHFALGATVVVTQGSGPGAYTQAQVVDGGSGRAGQTPLNLVYGLGSRTGTVEVAVYWPDGQTVQTYSDLAIGGYHTLQLDIQSSSTTFTRTFDPATGMYSWEFSWETDAETPAVDDQVVVTPDPAYPSCALVPATLIHDPPLVTASVTKVGSRYRHTMTWRDRDCAAPCRFFYDVSSRFGNVTWSLANAKPFKTLYCASAP